MNKFERVDVIIRELGNAQMKWQDTLSYLTDEGMEKFKAQLSWDQRTFLLRKAFQKPFTKKAQNEDRIIKLLASAILKDKGIPSWAGLQGDDRPHWVKYRQSLDGLKDPKEHHHHLITEIYKLNAHVRLYQLTA